MTKRVSLCNSVYHIYFHKSHAVNLKAHVDDSRGDILIHAKWIIIVLGDMHFNLSAFRMTEYLQNATSALVDHLDHIYS